MPYNFVVTDSIHTKKLYQTFFKWSAILDGKQPSCVIASPPLGGLGATCDVHLRLIRRRVVDFLSINWTFFARYDGWGATSKYRLKLGVFAPTGSVCPKISRRRDRPTNYSSCQKTRMNDLSCSIRTWPQVSFILSQCTLLTDRQTDRQTVGQTERPCNTVRCITCSRIVKLYWR